VTKLSTSDLGLAVEISNLEDSDQTPRVAQGLVFLRELKQLRSEVMTLREARERYLALIAKMTRETPYPDELEECRSSQRALIAEIGTLRSQLAEGKKP